MQNKKTYISNATIINEGETFNGGVLIQGDRILHVYHGDERPDEHIDMSINAKGNYLLPGVIDDHVHFRDPGLTHKANMRSESKAAIAGGVTSIMDMPNTKPKTTTIEAWNDKMQLASEKCLANYSCYFGASSDNYELLDKLDPKRFCGVKLFMGDSTGNMGVSENYIFEKFFCSTDKIIAVHAEDQEIIRANLSAFSGIDDIPLAKHPEIRNELACHTATSQAIKMAKKCNSRLHILHISTEMEMKLLAHEIDYTVPLIERKITTEACIPHIQFSQLDYMALGALIKVNPAIKKKKHREALRLAIKEDRIDVIATDHAPHTLEEKRGGALKAMSGMPSIQFGLIAMLSLTSKKKSFSMEQVVEKMCHNPAIIYGVEDRGFIREGYKADLVLVSPTDMYKVEDKDVLSSCGWTPMKKVRMTWKVEKTFVNGRLVYNNGEIDESLMGEELSFSR